MLHEDSYREVQLATLQGQVTENVPQSDVAGLSHEITVATSKTQTSLKYLVRKVRQAEAFKKKRAGQESDAELLVILKAQVSDVEWVFLNSLGQEEALAEALYSLRVNRMREAWGECSVQTEVFKYSALCYYCGRVWLEYPVPEGVRYAGCPWCHTDYYAARRGIGLLEPGDE